MDKKEKVEFIESYIKIGNTDYQWNDNHGELVRCKDCKYCYKCSDVFRFYNACELDHVKGQADDWYCADGRKKES